ncbi:MAG: phage Gp37/Gp68 family protein [Dehalococcoidia bacterium]
MADKSNISWTQTTWNVFSGCTKISPGCDHCYASELAERYRGTPAYPNGFDLTLRLHKMKDPLKWKEPREIFVNSMSDLFLGGVPEDVIRGMWDVMLATPQHMYQILTKRPIPAARIIADLELPVPDHIWLGVSVESQDYASRIDDLLELPGKNKFLSCEPLIGPLDIWDWLDVMPSDNPAIKWVIDGGESGAGRRLADPDWFRSIRDQCVAAGVLYYHKQGNAHRPGMDRVLDGRTWEQHPNRLELPDNIERMPALGQLQLLTGDETPAYGEYEHETMGHVIDLGEGTAEHGG